MMTLSELKGPYDAIYSLGHNCLPGVQLAKNGLRRYSGPIDWMGSPLLSGVSRALQERFASFMELRNLSVTGIDPNAGCYLVYDPAYHIVSNHDYPVRADHAEALLPYPEVKAKLDRRVDRMLGKLSGSSRILLVRTEGSYPELFELQLVLRSLVGATFAVLYVQHGDTEGIVDLGWRIPHVCAVQIPRVPDMFHDNDGIWRELLDGIYHV
ncbi:DUF1796 family putative cysteine peptidase [Paenibacillus pasadenensis]|uniref:Peptidase n=1 Tax=Paenibacillus pasadenensis TaxID=217090 RepID=A0A2N5N8S4_9BACL|nr:MULTISPECIES: DUF1796 family putative cysteine peptidase [Paenibacillus]PLT46756.1 hypothetical protein B8V81_0980 [Paenibacillus pasadenensis]